MSKAVDYVREQERGVNVTVIGTEDAGTPCQSCGSTGTVYSIHCWREELRPIAALCKPCAETRAGGVEHVAVRSDRLGLRAGWEKGERRLLSEKQMEQRRSATRKRVR